MMAREFLDQDFARTLEQRELTPFKTKEYSVADDRVRVESVLEPKHGARFTKASAPTKARKAARRRAKAGRKASR